MSSCIRVYVCECVYVQVCMRIYIMCAWLRVAEITDSYVQSKLGNGRFGFCSLWIRYTGDSKTNPRDDLEIRTDSYSEDQMAIRFQNRVISCKCLLLCYFLIYRCQ